MPFQKDKFAQKYKVDTVRWKKWDYGWAGYYFVTICCKNEINFFGEIPNKNIVYTQVGGIARDCWEDIPKHFPNVSLDYFVIMPNHFHGIISIDKEARRFKCRDGIYPVSTGKDSTILTLGNIVGTYKAAVSRRCKEQGILNFSWQPRFHDRIIRNEKELNGFRQYILDNIRNWEGK